MLKRVTEGSPGDIHIGEKRKKKGKENKKSQSRGDRKKNNQFWASFIQPPNSSGSREKGGKKRTILNQGERPKRERKNEYKEYGLL